jgi:antitoxin component YwqK of YwqJK toxin-antitoxin module
MQVQHDNMLISQFERIHVSPESQINHLSNDFGNIQVEEKEKEKEKERITTHCVGYTIYQTLTNCGFLHGFYELYYPNGNLHTRHHRYYGALHGKYEDFTDDGKLCEEGEYVNGTVNGIVKRYYTNTNININDRILNQIEYKNDIMHGNYKSFYMSGRVECSAQFENGLTVGKILWYTDDDSNRIIKEFIL